MIALLTLAAAIMPPAKEGPYEWCVRTFLDYGRDKTVCVTTATAARKEMEKQVKQIMTPAQAASWLSNIKLSQVATMRDGTWFLQSTVGTYTTVTMVNKGRNLIDREPVTDDYPAPAAPAPAPAPAQPGHNG